MKPLPVLQPGDCLLYRPSSLLDWLVCIKTGSRISHVEVYFGEQLTGETTLRDDKVLFLTEPVSIAARPFKGVDTHPLRTKNLAYVRRPIARDFVFNEPVARAYRGRKYDWLGLFTFFLAVRRGNTQRFFCSELATVIYRYCGQYIPSWDVSGCFDPFNPGVRADHISPADFYIAGTFETIWSSES